MFHPRIEAADPTLLDGAARQCGELAIGCTDAAGQVQSVAESIAAQMKVLSELQAVMASLETDQRQVTDATDEARILSESARVRLQEGADIIAQSIAGFAELTSMVTRLGGQITNFASAMDQVRRTTQIIDGIARTTNMLALNAAIEAEKAGEAGRTFAVVAAEVKKLARDTRAATEEIGATMDSLTSEGDAFVLEIQNGMARSRAAEAGFSQINETVAEVIGLVDQVDRQSDDIARATSLIHDSVCRVGDELDGFANAAAANREYLDDAHRRMETLEGHANGMLNVIVHSGLAHEDGKFVEIAVNGMAAIKTCIETAIANGKLAQGDVFDTRYVAIEGSNPPQFATRFNDFADLAVQPVLDAIAKKDRRIVSVVISDINGYLPTHLSEKSKPQQSGEAAWNALNCRNRCNFLDDATRKAIASEADFMMTTYRQNLGDNGFRAVKNVFVPLYFAGKRWGNFEVAYVD
jgi:methyl-accepting chemotaxis protein